MSEFNWRAENGSSNDKVPIESIPQRVALTATGIVMSPRTESGRSILLCNPHPESWNSWMLPYGSIQLDEIEVNKGVTFMELARFMIDVKNEHITEFRNTAFGQIIVTAGLRQTQSSDDPLLANFSLKYSKSANKWTLYYFNYFIFKDIDEVSPIVAAEWLQLIGREYEDVIKTRIFRGLKLAENVLPVITYLSASEA